MLFILDITYVHIVSRKKAQGYSASKETAQIIMKNHHCQCAAYSLLDQ